MIVTCPACDIRYTVPDTNLGGTSGRRVRCAHCGNLWHYSPEAAAIHAAIAETAAARETPAAPPPRPVMLPPVVSDADRPAPPRLNAAPESLPPAPRVDPEMAPSTATGLSRPAVATEVPGVARRRRRHIAEIVLLLLLIIVAAIVVFSRERLAQFVPALKPLMAQLHLTEPTTSGLSVTVTPTRSGDSLVIDGDITNSANVARPVPRLRVALRDINKEEVDSKEISPPVSELAPGAKAHFTTSFDHPNAAATGVAVTFTTAD